LGSRCATERRLFGSTLKSNIRPDIPTPPSLFAERTEIERRSLSPSLKTGDRFPQPIPFVKTGAFNKIKRRDDSISSRRLAFLAFGVSVLDVQNGCQKRSDYFGRVDFYARLSNFLGSRRVKSRPVC
jgi:hypothetical protein